MACGDKNKWISSAPPRHSSAGTTNPSPACSWPTSTALVSVARPFPSPQLIFACHDFVALKQGL